MIQAAHLSVNRLENLGSLLQAKDDILLYKSKLHIRRQLFQLFELRIRLGQQRFLVLFTPQRQQGFLLVASGEHLLRDIGLLVGQDSDASLVLM